LTSHSVWYNNNVEKDNEINKKVVGKTFKCDREYVMKKETKNKKLPVIKRDWCKGCGICIEFCPQDALSMDDMEKAILEYPEKCNSCGICELRCPDLAIELE
jgi:2-oxoglutarate ferredoxin oxidoreductase subunit delta